MVMPKIEREAEARNYGKFTISPLEGGYGVTLGNALRRVLLSSLEGTAISSIRIADVLHEFSDIPGVREDVIQVMLQVKQIRIKMDGVDSARMQLERSLRPILSPRLRSRSSILTRIFLLWMEPRQNSILNSWSNVAVVILHPMNAQGTCPSVKFPWMQSTAR
jgi:hypothetical protein